MKNIQLITKQISLWVLLSVSFILNCLGQGHKLGDLYTFEDGSKGIVFYLNPDDPSRGTVVALNDLDKEYALWEGNIPSVLRTEGLHYPYSDYPEMSSWPQEGKRFTELLKVSEVSPVADAISKEIEQGWYIPDLLQLRRVLAMAPFLKESFIAQEGDTFNMQKLYWSSNLVNEHSGNVYYSYMGYYYYKNGNMPLKVRLVRDFSDSTMIKAFWEDFPPLADTVVRPDSSRIYDALVIFKSDTIRLSSTVTVHQPICDTIHYVVEKQQLPDGEFTAACHTFTDITAPGSYTARDTLTAANGCDSIVVVTLIVTEDAHYYDTICPQMEQYAFAPFDTVFLAGSSSGEYVHHGSKVVDGHPVDTTAVLHLTVLPVYDTPDTVSWCLYGSSETMPYGHDSRVILSAETIGGTVTVSATSSTSAITIEEGTSSGDFLLRMTTVHGCDSIVRLHVAATPVTRDTVRYAVQDTQLHDGEFTAACHTFTGISAPGTYTARDTLTAANGCDSIVVVTLIVIEEAHYYDTICPQMEQYAFAPFDTVFLAGSSSGEYVHHGSKVVDGHPVDTTAVLHLTVLPVYDIPDTVSWCLYGSSETMPYEHDPRVTLTAETNGGTVIVSATSSTSAITIEEGTSSGDFLLRMTTVHGCDSIVRLHVAATPVTRDTMRYAIQDTQLPDGEFTAACHTFTGISALGSYTAHDTLTAANGCDSIVVIELIVNGCSVDFTINCPPDIYDTLAFGDCTMAIYPEEIGTPTIQCDEEWPFFIRNDMPESSVFAPGDNIITWIATDSICGFSDTCEQHVFIAYPQCPDAIDCEGNIYAGIRIGCDCWTQRNLESTKYSDCTDIPNVMGYASLLHSDTAENIAIFGRLYTFEAAVRDSADNGHGHIQGICPEGWYLPTPEKYESLNEYGAEALRSPLYWIIGAGNNSTGFSALPAGYYNGSRHRYEGLLSESHFWSSQGVDTYTMRTPSLITYYCDQVLFQNLSGGLGYSVRCIKEKE